MLLKSFSIRDVKAKAFIAPFFLPNAEMAQRQFAEAVNAPDHQFNKHSADYELYEIGIWSDDSALFKPHEEPLLICNGAALRRDPDPISLFDLKEQIDQLRSIVEFNK